MPGFGVEAKQNETNLTQLTIENLSINLLFSLHGLRWHDRYGFQLSYW